ncbi:oxysterol-binding protein-related protein 8 isoform X4 [Hermetia illucens]|uniref:oxysterol-binding protein-related protein 8 isoform X4 n=1 Tax=Hermetia illucens TaxID=343691 RepID=UPI0018CBF7C4|nr:oxysterol-binding protein-related protein 8 isoform X4 [Hermetia illucens]
MNNFDLNLYFLWYTNGAMNWTDSTTKIESNSTEKLSDASKLNRKESYKAQRKNYRREKKRVASELLNSLQDPAVVVLADWLKVRGTLKSWTKLWCVLKPGLLLLYKNPKIKSSHWVGTILLTSCQVIERPSKKDGFCFKLFHPLEQSIWAPRGPDKETIGAVVQPLPTAYLIFRAPSQAAGKCWMDALELSLRCSALLLRSNSNTGSANEPIASGTISHETQWSEADYEKHFNDAGEKPVFMATYTPPSPLIDQYKETSISPYAPHTPIFQQLCLAVSHWERVMSHSPDYIKQKFRKAKRTSRGSRKKEYHSDMSDLSDNEGLLAYNPLIKRAVSSSAFDVSVDNDNHDENDIQAGIHPVNYRNGNADLDVDSQNEGAAALMSGPESESESDVGDGMEMEVEEMPETPYVHLPEEEFGAAGEQVEELPEEHKSLIWFLVKQVRPGMDLSKVVLPTFILEPRSFLDKLSDSYYHADYLARAVLEDDPFTRMKAITQWYMSGFYKKPKGLKKPYNPILGETFRCYWEHPNGSRTFYIAEQVSHHPPISAFYVTNRQDGFCISCSILAKSKFYGNSTSAILDGVATLTLLPRGENYTLTVPYAHCKGILMGTLSMELGGKVSIECENTGYKADIEFKLKPFLGGADQTNLVSGRIKLGKETLATIQGHWDSEIRIKDSRTQEESVLFVPSGDVRTKRLKRYTVPIESQNTNESERLWQHVSAAIYRDDQVAATEEKTALEEIQRAAVKERKAKCIEWIPVHFQQDLVTGQWHYKYADLRPWDPRNDLKQYESEYRIQTKTRHSAPMVRTTSIVSGEPITILQGESRSSLVALKQNKRILKSKRVSKGSSPEAAMHDSDSSQSLDGVVSSRNLNKLEEKVERINKTLEEHAKRLGAIQLALEKIKFAPIHSSSSNYQTNRGVYVKAVIFIFVAFATQYFVSVLRN